MFYLRQSTADQIDILGPFIDDTDGKTAETGLTIANTDIRLSKNGGNMGAKNSGGGTHDELGYYAVTYDATDSDTVGRLKACVHVAGALPVWTEYQVLEEDAYDFLFAAGATPIADIKSEADDALTDIGLDHLIAAADGDDPVDGSIMAHLAAASEDWSDFVPSTDSLQALRDRGDAAWPTATGFSTHSAADVADAVQDEAIEDHDTQGTVGWATALAVYPGSDGPGIYVDSGAGNTNTTVGTDGTEINPVSTFAAARDLADALGVKIYYLEGNADITLAATHVDWEFIGIGSVADNIVNLGSQDVSRSLFRNLTVEGTQGGSGRITARDCALQDPGAGDTTLHIFAERCGIVDRIQVDTSADNVFDQCFSLVAGASAPVIEATGASGTIAVRHYSGGMEFEALSASHNVTWEGIGQVIFNANNNSNANVSVRGIGSITDNASMGSLTETSLVNMTKINAEADTALADYDGPTNAEMDARTLAAGPLAQLTQNLDNCITGTASGTPTTTTMVSDIGVTVNDQFAGRIITFDDDTTTAELRQQSTDVTASTAASNTLIFTELTTAPVSGDKFVIT